MGLYVHLEQGNNGDYCFINVTAIYTALFPAFTLNLLFCLVFTIHRTYMGIKIYAGKSLRPLGHSKNWWHLWSSLQKGVCACEPLPPASSQIQIPFSKGVDFTPSYEWPFSVCRFNLKVFLLLQLLSPPCLVNFYRNPRQVLSTSASLRIRCQSPYSSGRPIDIRSFRSDCQLVACSFSPFLEHGFGWMQIRWT